MTKLADLKQRLLENPEVREEYAQANAEFSLIEAMITARREATAGAISTLIAAWYLLVYAGIY